MSNKVPPFAYNVKFVACPSNHVHLIMLGENDEEMVEMIFNTVEEYNNFAMMLGACAINAFTLKAPTETLQ